MISTEKIVVILCALWIIIDRLFFEELFEANHKLALRLQHGEKNSKSLFYQIFETITLLGDKPLYVSAVMIALVFFANKIEVLKVSTCTVMARYLLSTIKLIYHEPRPYFIYHDLQGIGCDQEFGNPSGHSMVSLVVYFLLLDSLVSRRYSVGSASNNYLNTLESNQPKTELMAIISNNRSDLENQQDTNKANSLQKYPLLQSKLIFTIYALIICLIGVSRVVLGVHSFGQVLLGWTIGILVIIGYKNLENVLEIFLFRLIKRNSQPEIKRYTIIISGIYLACNVFQIFLYQYINSLISEQDKMSYADSIRMKPYCKKVDPDGPKFLANKCFSDTATISMMFAILLSLMYTRGKYNPSKWNESYSSLSIFQKIMRIIILAIVFGLSFIPLSYVKFDDIYFHFIFKSSIKAFLLPICVLTVYPIILNRLKLDIEGDLLKYENEDSEEQFEKNSHINLVDS